MNTLSPSEDGLYFGLSEEAYHAEPRLSASLMKWLRVSTMDCWARSWLNPDKEPEEETDGKELGTAYHCRVLEGRQKFLNCYAAALDKRDYPDALVTSDDIRAELVRLGLKGSAKLKSELIARLLEADPSAQIWDDLVSQNARKHAGKILLDHDQIVRLEIAAAMIEKHPTLGKAITGGYPEVSCFWTDEATGVRLKCRFDYLKVGAVVDLKTLANQNGRPIDRAIYAAMANYRYHIQAAHYLDAVEIAREFARNGQVSGDVDLNWLGKFAAGPEATFLFVFQQTGLAPVARGRVFPRRSMYQIGQATVREMIEQFAACLKKFGSDPWVDMGDIEEFDDAMYPAYATE